MRFRTLFLFFVLAELTSLAGYFFPTLNAVGFFLIVIAALVLSMRRLEYGLCFVLADLILGGKSGALFSFHYGGFLMSLRMALFIIVMGVWAGKVVASHFHNAPLPPLKIRGGVLWWWALLGIAVGWGMIVGFLRGNSFSDLFLDANGYFFAAMVLPAMWSVIQKDENGRHEWMRMLGTVFLTATTWITIKTLLSVYIFTHAGNMFIGANLVAFYRWVRDTGVGEITWLPGNFARVFFQSHVYNVVAFFSLISVLFENRAKLYDRAIWRVVALMVLNMSVIVVSLSRSFWIGVAGGLLVIGFFAIRGKYVKRFLFIFFAALAVSAILLLVVARFPFPRPSPADLGDAVQSRLEAGDAGQSRWNLLPPLLHAALLHPIVGSGFGTAVTYISNDPRIREVNRAGTYTTTAFEWGWIDLWLKMGVLGIIAYLGLLITLVYRLYVLYVHTSSTWAVAGLGSVVALSLIHIFTPYLNHPLGFGILIIMTVLGVAKHAAL